VVGFPLKELAVVIRGVEAVMILFRDFTLIQERKIQAKRNE
jgi:hypothetical protein